MKNVILFFLLNVFVLKLNAGELKLVIQNENGISIYANNDISLEINWSANQFRYQNSYPTYSFYSIGRITNKKDSTISLSYDKNLLLLEKNWLLNSIERRDYPIFIEFDSQVIIRANGNLFIPDEYIGRPFVKLNSSFDQEDSILNLIGFEIDNQDETLQVYEISNQISTQENDSIKPLTKGIVLEVNQTSGIYTIKIVHGSIYSFISGLESVNCLPGDSITPDTTIGIASKNLKYAIYGLGLTRSK